MQKIKLKHMDLPVDRRNRVYLRVPYEEKDTAKALGA